MVWLMVVQQVEKWVALRAVLLVEMKAAGLVEPMVEHLVVHLAGPSVDSKAALTGCLMVEQTVDLRVARLVMHLVAQRVAKMVDLSVAKMVDEKVEQWVASKAVN